MKDIVMIILCIISIAVIIYVALTISIKTGAQTTIMLGSSLLALDALITPTDKY